jgi:peptidylprolyl isomerase
MKSLLNYMSVVAIVFTFTAVSIAQKAVRIAEGGLTYMELAIGSGPVAETGNIAVIHFTGWIDDNGKKGNVFFDSRYEGKPVAFKIGTDIVIEGWNIGVVGMQPGGRRMLTVPSDLGYGAEGAADVVPPNADLIFDIELLEVRQ